jgi:hypothetical protein
MGPNGVLFQQRLYWREQQQFTGLVLPRTSSFNLLGSLRYVSATYRNLPHQFKPQMNRSVSCLLMGRKVNPKPWKLLFHQLRRPLFLRCTFIRICCQRVYGGGVIAYRLTHRALGAGGQFVSS